MPFNGSVRFSSQWVAGMALALACAAPGAPPASPEDPPAAPATGSSSRRAAAERHWMDIRAFAVRGAYLDVTLANDEEVLRLFLPARAECRALVEDRARVRFLPAAGGGLLKDEEGNRCAPVGTTTALLFASSRGLPRDWQRERSESHPPRVQAEFVTIHRGEEILQLRGRFPLATELRWAAAMDTVALIPNRADCQHIAQRRDATLELDRKGAEPLRLLDAGSICPILGFAVPLEDVPAGP